MAARDDIVKQASDGALDFIRKNGPKEYAKLTPAQKKELTEATRSMAAEYVQLEAEFKGDQEDRIAERLAKYLPKDRIELIKAGLTIPTFQLDLIKRDDGTYRVNLSRGGEPFMEGTRDLATVEDIDSAKVKQYASILVEAVLLVMSAVGIKVSVYERVMSKTIKVAAEAIQASPALEGVINDFVNAWKEAGGSNLQKAKAIFALFKDIWKNGGGTLWKIIKSLCTNMSWWDWVKTAAIVTASIIAPLSTDGDALIAQILLALHPANLLGKKVANVTKLNEIRKTM